MLRHYVAFINPRTNEREQIWFRTNRARREFIADLQQDFGATLFEEWETPVAEDAA